MKLSMEFNFSNFESLSENSEQKLVGGFSPSVSLGVTASDLTGGSNNCEGGNCIAGCGKGQNTGCNVVSGCGT